MKKFLFYFTFLNFLNNSFFQFLSKLTKKKNWHAFMVVKSKSKLCNYTTYIREFKLTFFAFKKDISHCSNYNLEGLCKKFLLTVLFLKFVVFLTDLHTSHEGFAPWHGLDIHSLSNWGKAALTKWSLRLLAFLKPVVRTSEKIVPWAWSTVSKRRKSLRISLTPLKRR